jgi:signal transduction histidine kinase
LPRDLQIVFSNLLDNAVKYGGEEPKVFVQARPQGDDRVVARISDNGRGIRFELRRKIFQRFFRGGSELERTTKGTGLGLYIVKNLVKKMKGRVNVHGRGPLNGATFEVEFPGHAISAPMADPAVPNSAPLT